jgi:hypothetical protein
LIVYAVVDDACSPELGAHDASQDHAGRYAQVAPPHDMSTASDDNGSLSTAVVTALIAAGVSIIISVWTAIWSRRSEQRLTLLEDTLAEARAERDAQRDYLYEARKRLYTEFQPLLFQLIEQCESSRNRIFGLAEAGRDGHLQPGQPGWLDSGYYLYSTIYRMLAPLVIVRLARRRLTVVDLSVDPQVRFQYAMAKQLHVTWNETWELAASEPAIPYDPHHPDAIRLARTQPEVYGYQHIVAGYLDQAVDALIVRNDSTDRCMSYGEFEDAISGARTPLQDRTGEFAALFTGFHPQLEPVLWRTLLAQAHLFQALIESFEVSGQGPTPGDAFRSQDSALFDWRTAESEVSFDEAVTAPLAAVRGFLRERVPGPPAAASGEETLVARG